MRPLWPAVSGKFVSKRAATATFQKLAVLTAVDSQQAMAVAGVDVWLIQAFCLWGSRVILEYIRDCHLTSAEDVSRRVTHGLRLMECVRTFTSVWSQRWARGKLWNVSGLSNKYWKQEWLRWGSGS